MAKGLEAALLKGTQATNAKKNTPSESKEIADLQLLPLAIELIHPDPDQPRTEWEAGELDELATAIEETGGCHTPIKVRPHPEKLGEYMIVYGEGRWRSHHLKNIPLINALIDTDFSNTESEFSTFFVQVTENISRNPMKKIDEANAYNKLMALHKPTKLTQTELSTKVGKPKTYISRVLKLLKAPYEVQELSILNVTQNLNVLAYLAQLSDIVTNDELLQIIDEVRKGDLGEKALQRHLSELQNPVQDTAKDDNLSEERHEEQLHIEDLDRTPSDSLGSVQSEDVPDYGFYDYGNVYEKALFDALFALDLAFEISEEQKEEAIDKLETVTNDCEGREFNGIKYTLSELLDGFKKALIEDKEPIKTMLNIRCLRALFRGFLNENAAEEKSAKCNDESDKGEFLTLEAYEICDNYALLTLPGLDKPLKLDAAELQEILDNL